MQAGIIDVVNNVASGANETTVSPSAQCKCETHTGVKGILPAHSSVSALALPVLRQTLVDSLVVGNKKTKSCSKRLPKLKARTVRDEKINMGHLKDQVGANVAELVVVRHGETTWNAIDRFQGQEESDLTEVGIKQAQAVANRLAKTANHIRAVYSSDLRRASETARRIADAIGFPNVVELASLRERHLGNLQGLTKGEAQVVEPEAYRASVSSDPNEPIPGGGESLNQLNVRTKEALESIALNHLGQRVIVVCHGGVLRSLYFHAKGCQASGKVRNTSINVFRITASGDWSLRSWGDVNHLQGTDLLQASTRGDELR
ncbi:hypothetical protein R1sor_018772 [Riccia sorocarpa]|uniref:Phosphoglycerate mutase n=1 Tax=Riccia sorocarpa TaxID=122646 RepID=A0ABD3IE77_9MARC